jgi:hypothetical protein
VKSKSRLPYIGKADDIGRVLKGVQNRRPTFQKWPWHLAKDMNIEEENYNKENNENIFGSQLECVLLWAVH